MRIFDLKSKCFLLFFAHRSRSDMVSASPVTTRYFLVKWIYITGERVKNFEVDRFWSFGGDEDDIRPNDKVST